MGLRICGRAAIRLNSGVIVVVAKIKLLASLQKCVLFNKKNGQASS